MSCGVGCRRGSDPVLLWLWPTAVAPIRPLAWESPYAVGVALKKKKSIVARKETWPLGSRSTVVRAVPSTTLGDIYIG